MAVNVSSLADVHILTLQRSRQAPRWRRLIRGAQVKEVGQALGAPVLDLWTALQREPVWEALLEDGLHFTEAGQRAVRDALLSFIRERLPHLRCAPD